MIGQQVKQFNETYRVNRKDIPTLPETTEEMTLMGELIMEEITELAIAYDAKDRIGFYDALLDIIYVTAQQADKFGFDIDGGLVEVHKSNMSKLDENGNPIFREDGKVLKGPNYQPPKLEKLLEK